MLTIDRNRLFLVEKETIVTGLFYGGMAVAFYTSLNPWFLWWLFPFFPILSSMLLFAAMLISRTMRKPVFTRGDFLFPILAYLVFAYYQRLVNGDNFNGYITTAFHTFIFYSLFRYDSRRLFPLSTFLAKSMACLLLVSIPFYLLYVVGFPLPSSDLQYNDAFYTFSNYYFFLLDDRQLFVFVPRFQSVFLEPAHLGTALVVLLQAQRGHWRRWYNMVLLTGTFLSFSLGAYVYLVAIIFLNLWVGGKKIVLKVLLAVSLISAVIAGSFFYNDGDNLVHNLILLRLDMDDSDVENRNNRTTEEFDADYDNFLQSSDILFGRDKENTFGDSGYKVFIYDYGFVGLLLLIVFYTSALGRTRNKRAFVSAMVVATLIFGVDAFVMWYNRFIPLFCTAYDE